MDQVTRIIEDVKKEKNRNDKIFKGATFEVRTEQVIMFFNYDEIINTQNEKRIIALLKFLIAKEYNN